VQGCVNDDLRADGLWKGWGFRVGTWYVDSLTGRSGEVVEALSDRTVDVASIQERRWKGSCCKFYGAKLQPLLYTTIILQFIWILSETTRVSWYQKGKTRKTKPIWIYWSKR